MRRLLVGVVLGALAVAGAPALADHVTEPTEPITGIELKVQDYGTKTQYACDGTDEFDFFQVRAEAVVTADAAPSEHFTVGLGWLAVDPTDEKHPNTMRRVLAGNWRHQNIPPHPKPLAHAGWEVMSMNPGLLPVFPGLQTINVKVTGAESGLVFEDTCSWIQVES